MKKLMMSSNANTKMFAQSVGGVLVQIEINVTLQANLIISLPNVNSLLIYDYYIFMCNRCCLPICQFVRKY